MSRIRAYLDRIQGRPIAALTPGALGMLAIYLVSSRTLAHFSASSMEPLMVADRLKQLVSGFRV
jgi:hypothetical protein